MGTLVSQKISNQGTLTQNVINQTQFTEMEHRSSDLVLVNLIADYLFAPAGDNTEQQVCDFAIIAKNISEGAVVQDDFNNEKYVIGKTHRRCHMMLNNTNNQIHADEFHFEVSLKIKIPIDWQVFFAILNSTGVTARFAYLVRLFWTLV